MNRLRGILVLLISCAMPVTVSAQMMFIGEINTTNSSRIDIDGAKAAIIDGSNLLFYDITYPNDPAVLSSLFLPGTLSGLDLSGNYAYVAAGDSGMLVIDISTPTDPHWVGRYFGEFASIDVAARDTICYLMEFERVTIINVADPANPSEIAHQDVSFIRNDAMAVGDNMLYLVGDVGEFEFIFGYDISNPAAPYRRSNGFDFWSVSDMIIADSRLFIANATWNYISTFNIANPDSIIEQSVLTMSGPTAIIPVNGLFYVSSKDGGITELDCSDPDTSIVLDSVDTPGVSRDIASMGNYLFLADSNSIQIFWRFMDNTSNDATLPQAPGILSNYPDPFNAQTTISFSLDHSGPVALEVYDLLGRRVAALVDGLMLAGEHQVIWDARNRASGAYYLSLRAGNQSATLRMTLLK